MVTGRRLTSFPGLLKLLKMSSENEGNDMIGSSTGELADLRLRADTRLSDLLGTGGGCGIDAGR